MDADLNLKDLADRLDLKAENYEPEQGTLAYRFATQRDAIAEAVLKAQAEAGVS